MTTTTRQDLIRELQRRIDEPLPLGGVLQRDDAFKSAAIRRDRAGLRDAVAQKASELGVPASDLLHAYSLRVLGGLASRLELEFDAVTDGANLERASEAFRLDFAMKCVQFELCDVM